MSKLSQEEQKKKTLTQVIASGAVGAVLVPVINRAVKPVIQRVIIPSLGPVAGTIVNAAFFVVIPPVAAMIGEVVAEKGPNALSKATNFAKGVTIRVKDRADARKFENLQKTVVNIKREEKARLSKEAESTIEPGSHADLVNKVIKDGINRTQKITPDSELEDIIKNLKKDNENKA